MQLNHQKEIAANQARSEERLMKLIQASTRTAEENHREEIGSFVKVLITELFQTFKLDGLPVDSLQSQPQSVSAITQISGSRSHMLKQFSTTITESMSTATLSLQQNLAQ